MGENPSSHLGTALGEESLVGAVAERSRELIQEICKVNEVEIFKGACLKRSCAFVCFSSTKLSVSKVMQKLEGEDVS